MPLDVLDVVELRSKGIRDVDNDDLPVGLALIEESHDAKDLDLLDLTHIADLLTNLAYIKWVIIALGLGLSVRLRRVFPGLQHINNQQSATL